MNRIKDISEFRSPSEVASDNVLKAPNGKKSNLTEKQHAMVRTPEFKKFFGDWESDPENASKIVDGNGEPMVVYHGTPTFGFDEFINDYKMPRATANETNNLGSWFTNDRAAAEGFMFGSDKGGIYEVFLNVRNPKVFKPAIFKAYEIDALQDSISAMEADKRRLGQNTNDMTPDDRDEWNKLESAIKDAWMQIKLLRHADSFEQFMNYRDKYADYGQGKKGVQGAWLERYIAVNKDETNKKLVKELTDGQFDGIAIVDTHFDARRKNSKISQYCVFDPTQVKSVDNNGRFGTGTKNMYESNIYVKGIDTFDI